MKIPGFVGGAYTHQSLPADAQSCVNLYPEAIESGSGKVPAALMGAPGLALLATLATSPIRGIWIGENRLFVVAGAILYEVSSGWVATSLGNVGNDGHPVQIFPNGNEIIIISNSLLWVHNGVTLSNPTFTDAPLDPVTSIAGAYLDGYFVSVDAPDAGDPESVRRLRHSAPGTGLTWSALDYASKEGYPDQLVQILADHEDLWLFGSQTTEVWRNNYPTAPEAFPWERDPGAFIHHGCIARWTPCRLADGIAWLSGDPRGHAVAYRAQGYQPKRISTHALEREWAGYSTVADAEAYSYTEDGHHFWVLHFPTANRTWVYDATTGLWHRRGWWNGTALQRSRARCHGYVFGKHIVGDWENGKLYEQRVGLYDDFGGDRYYERTVPHTTEENKRVFFHRFELDAENGLGIAPKLYHSNDGGRTFGTAKDPQNADVLSDYTTRFVWHRGGSSRKRCHRVTITGQKKVVLLDAYIDATAGGN